MSHFGENFERKESCELIKDKDIVTDNTVAKHRAYVINSSANWYEVWRTCCLNYVDAGIKLVLLQQ